LIRLAESATVRILVASDRIGALSSRQAGRVIANGWPTTTRTVVPLGEAGRGFVQAYGDLLGADTEHSLAPDGAVTVAQAAGTAVVGVEAANASGNAIAYHQSSSLIGAAIATTLARRPRRLVIDLAGVGAHDAGAGMLGALGARADGPLDSGVAGLSQVSIVDLSEVRQRLAGVELIGVVRDAELGQRLLGLRGVTSTKGRAAGVDPETLLATDAALEHFAGLAAAEFTQTPGAGAAGGLGFAILALGGRLTTGPRLAFEVVGALPALDLVITGCDVFDFATRGGGVVAEAARRAEQVLCPCIALAGEVLIGGREMRTMGIEAAYELGASAAADAPGEEGLAALARRVARSWRW
jgi:glycerate 2-kinase